LRLAAQRTLRAPPIPCAAVKRHPCRFTALSFCGAKTRESPQPASLPARLRQTPSIRRWRIAMETVASMPQMPGTLCGNFTSKSEKVFYSPPIWGLLGFPNNFTNFLIFFQKTLDSFVMFS
jgi:hypothetical protein